MSRRIYAFLLFAASALSAADFQDYQAARAVIGQPSFSSHDKGVTPRALSLAKGNLYVADTSGQILTYDLSRLGTAKSPGCPVCLATPQSTTAQAVFDGIAAVALNGRNIAIVDPKSHRVMIWTGVSPLEQPNVVLSGFANPASVALDNQRLFVGDTASHHVYIWNTLPTRDSQPPDVTLGPADTLDAVGSDTIQNPTALASDGTNLFVADLAAHRVLVFSPADLASPQITNSATLAPGAVAPGTLISIERPAGTKLTVFLNGSPVAITDTNGDLLQVQIPLDLYNAAAGSLWIRNDLEDGSAVFTRPAVIHFAPTSPGIFAFGSNEPRTGLLLHSTAGIPLSPENPGKPSDLLTVWATGLGAVTPDANREGAFETIVPVRATINGNPVEVVSAVLPAEATGVYEVRLRLPSQLSSTAILVLYQNELKSNTVTFPVAQNQN